MVWRRLDYRNIGTVEKAAGKDREVCLLSFCIKGSPSAHISGSKAHLGPLGGVVFRESSWLAWFDGGGLVQWGVFVGRDGSACQPSSPFMCVTSHVTWDAR